MFCVNSLICQLVSFSALEVQWGLTERGALLKSSLSYTTWSSCQFNYGKFSAAAHIWTSSNNLEPTPPAFAKLIRPVLIYVPAIVSDNDLAVGKFFDLTTTEFCLRASGLLKSQTKTHSEKGLKMHTVQNSVSTNTHQVPTSFQACRRMPGTVRWEKHRPAAVAGHLATQPLMQSVSLGPVEEARPPLLLGKGKSQKSLQERGDVCSAPEQ